MIATVVSAGDGAAAPRHQALAVAAAAVVAGCAADLVGVVVVAATIVTAKR